MLLFLRVRVYLLSKGRIKLVIYISRTALRIKAFNLFDYIYNRCVACKMEIFHVLLLVGTDPCLGSALLNLFFLTTQLSGFLTLFYPGLLVAVNISYLKKRRAT